MKKTKLFTVIGTLSLLLLCVTLISSDHLDGTNIEGTTSDIADFYAFEGENPDSTVFIATIQGNLNPGGVTDNANFDEDVLLEFNIDNTGDFVEDLVIQAIKRGDSIHFFGPVTPNQTGLESQIITSTTHNVVQISTSSDTYITNENGMSFFAGPRRDPFYFDMNRFIDIKLGLVNWKRLHVLIYPAGFFAGAHYVMVKKVWEDEALIYLIVILGLFAVRFVIWKKGVSSHIKKTNKVSKINL